MSARILVTGAAGLLGGVLAKRLAEEGPQVVATARRPGAGPQSSEFVGCELSDPDAVRSLIEGKGFDVIVHAAARISGERERTGLFVRDNILATANLLDAARASNVRRFIYCSSISVYSGNGPYAESSAAFPSDPYGWTKRRGEELCLQCASTEFSTVVLRLGGLHGHPRSEGVVHEFFRRAIRGEPIQVSEPETEMTLTFLDDVAAVVARVIAASVLPQEAIYNVATAEAVRLAELAESVRECTGSKSRLVLAKSDRVRNRVLTTGRLRNELGFAASPLRAHLERFLQHARAG